MSRVICAIGLSIMIHLGVLCMIPGASSPPRNSLAMVEFLVPPTVKKIKDKPIQEIKTQSFQKREKPKQETAKHRDNYEHKTDQTYPVKTASESELLSPINKDLTKDKLQSNCMSQTDMEETEEGFEGSIAKISNGEQLQKDAIEAYAPLVKTVEYHPPVLIKDLVPAYPEKARFYGWEGDVVLEFTVTSEGHLKDVKIVSSSGYKILDQSALTAAAKWLYSPAQQNGKTMESNLKRMVRFRLD